MSPGVYTQFRDKGLPSRPTIIPLQSPEVIPTPPAPSIVQDGLLFYVDAGNPSSYSGTGTSWYDLSGNGYNATLLEPDGSGTGLPTFDSSNGGSIVFSGNYAKVDPFPATFPTGSAVRTLSAWFKITSYGVWQFAPIFGIGNNSYAGGRTLLGATPLGAEGGKAGLESGAGLYTLNWPGQLASAWTNLTVVTAATVQTSLLYINGVAIPPNDPSIRTSGGDASINTTNASCVIGAIPRAEFSVYNFNGNISVAMLYNRGLTEAEILQNFNVHKDRYGY